MERKNINYILKFIKHTSNSIPNIPPQLLHLVGDFHIASRRSFCHQKHNKSPRYFYPPRPSGHGFCLLMRWYVKTEFCWTTFNTSQCTVCTNETNSYNIIVQILSSRWQLLWLHCKTRLSFGFDRLVLPVCRKRRSYHSTSLTQVCRVWRFCSSSSSSTLISNAQ